MRRGPEGKVQDKLIKYLKEKGILYKKQEVGRFFVASGWPDLMVLPGGGRVFFIEVKSPVGVASPLQKKRIEKLQKQGYNVYIVRGEVHGKAIIDRECAGDAAGDAHPRRKQAGRGRGVDHVVRRNVHG